MEKSQKWKEEIDLYSNFLKSIDTYDRVREKSDVTSLQQFKILLPDMIILYSASIIISRNA